MLHFARSLPGWLLLPDINIRRVSWSACALRHRQEPGGRCQGDGQAPFVPRGCCSWAQGGGLKGGPLLG